MSDYKKLYEKYEEDTEVHAEVVEVVKAESDLNEFMYKELRHHYKALEIDAIIGKIARAYEIQGFNMGLAVAGVQI